MNLWIVQESGTPPPNKHINEYHTSLCGNYMSFVPHEKLTFCNHK